MRAVVVRSSSVRAVVVVRVVLVGCVSGKLAGAAQAQDLYTTPLFLRRRAYAEAAVEELGTCWLVLSAKHGLIPPNQVVHPYDEQLVRARVSDFSVKVRTSLMWWIDELEPADERLGPLVLEVHAGVHYVDGVERAVRWLNSFGDMHTRITVEAPLKGLAIGRQFQWYDRRAEARELEFQEWLRRHGKPQLQLSLL